MCLSEWRAHHGDEATDEAEVGEVVWIDGGGGVDLETVVVLASVLEQTVHGVQHLMGEQEEPLSGGERWGGRQQVLFTQTQFLVDHIHFVSLVLVPRHLVLVG